MHTFNILLYRLMKNSTQKKVVQSSRRNRRYEHFMRRKRKMQSCRRKCQFGHVICITFQSHISITHLINHTHLIKHHISQKYQPSKLEVHKTSVIEKQKPNQRKNYLMKFLCNSYLKHSQYIINPVRISQSYI